MNVFFLLRQVNLLDLTTSLLTVPKSHLASKARYIPFPPLTHLPSSLPSLIRSRFSSNPALNNLLPSILSELKRPANRSEGIEDESVNSLVERRFGKDFARNYLSAIVHGIYAADARVLSVRAAFPFLWDAEESGNGSIVKGILKSAFSPRKEVKPGEDERSFELGNLKDIMKNVSMFTFKDGMETLPRALVDWLSTKRNAELKISTRVSSIKPTSSGIDVSCPQLHLFSRKLIIFLVVQLVLSDDSTLSTSHVISTIPLPTLSTLLPPIHTLPNLASNTSSTVLVINLIFPPSPDGKPYHPEGFGYLVPRPSSDYASSLPSPSLSGEVDISPSLLGVIFDSAMPSFSSSQIQPTPSNLTRLALMLGGPHPLPSPLPPVQTLLPPLLTTLSSTLNLPFLPQPLHSKISLQQNCIPTYRVGHLKRMAELREALSGGEWNGNMQVIGNGVGGVSLGDCVMQGREAARKVVGMV